MNKLFDRNFIDFHISPTYLVNRPRFYTSDIHLKAQTEPSTCRLHIACSSSLQISCADVMNTRLTTNMADRRQTSYGLVNRTTLNFQRFFESVS